VLKDKANLRSVTGSESDAEAQVVVVVAWLVPVAARVAAVADVVRSCEKDKAIRGILMDTIGIANALYAQGRYPYAMLELAKAAAILEECYDMSMFADERRQIRQMEARFKCGTTQRDCDKAARLISTMYQGVWRSQKKAVRTDHSISISA
jgi:hypothetical protein